MSANSRLNKLALSYGQLLVAIGFATVPAVATCFGPRWNALRWGWRAALFAAWAVAAVFVARWATRRDSHIDALAERQRDETNDSREIALAIVLEAITTAPLFDDLPAELTVYGFNASSGRLEPTYPSAADDPDWEVKCFEPGKGATGLAWTLGSTVVVKRGTEVHDGTHGLTEDQQELFADYEVVASTVITNDANRPFGVVSAIAVEDDGYFDGAGTERLLAIAAALGETMDLLQPITW